MRNAVALFLLGGALLAMPGEAKAAPLSLGDQAKMSREAALSPVEEVARKARYKRYAYTKRRYDWTYLPYWRPYQYRYWKFYYPYGGPLF
jgi:hypothetical protein